MEKQILIAFLMLAPTASTHANQNLLNSTLVTPMSMTLGDSSRVVDLDEVIIVAQPKENQLLRQQPLASNVFTDKELRRLGVRNLSQLSSYIPSMEVPQYGSRYTSSIYVRGIGSRSGDPAVGVYYDNIPLMSKASLNRHFYQLDRIDVLRGPQATLYGMNAEGGLLRIYSKNPMSYQGTDILLGMGTGLYSNVEVAQYHRPNKHFAFSVAGFYQGLKGFFDNDNFKDKNDLTNEAGGRMRLMFRPDNGLTVDLTADYQYVNQNGFAYGEYSSSTNSFANPATTLMNGYKRQMVTTGLNIGYATSHLLFTSVTSYQYLKDLMQMDQDYLTADYMRLLQRQKMNALTEEFIIRSRGNHRWQHTSGLFFSHEWLHTNGPVYFGEDMNVKIKSSILSAVLNNDRVPAFVKGMLQGMNLTDNWVPGQFKTPRTNIGIYHESNINITPRLVATFGLRYDWQRVSIDYNTQSTFNVGLSGQMMGQAINLDRTVSSVLESSTTENYNQLLPKVALTYKFVNGSNVYATVSKGFRAGGYNLQMFADIFQTEQRTLGSELMNLMKGDYTRTHTAEEYDQVNQTITYKPETSWNYELGTHLNLFGGKVHADLATYLMQIRNQQLAVMAGHYGYGRMMINAGRSRSIGVETSLRGSAFSDRLSWAATYNYTNSTFRNYSEVSSVNGGVQIDYRGNNVPFVPAHAFSTQADWLFPIAETGLLRSITIGANVTGNGNIYWDAANTVNQKFYAVLGAHVACSLGRSVVVNLWGRNLTDTRYATFLVQSSVDNVNRAFAQRGNPLQVGLDVSIKIF